MKRHIYLPIAFVVAIALGLWSCAPAQKQTSSKPLTAKEIVANARKHVCEISVSEAKELFDKGGWLFLDCREPKEFKMGHIPGAMNIPRGLVEFKVGNKIPEKNTKIIVYCKSGGRGCLTACTLCSMGYKDVRNMAGGWLAWEKAGYPVE